MTARVSFDFTGTSVLLTGGTSGIGHATALLFRDAGVAVVWPQFLIVAAIGGAFFALAHQRLRKTISAMQA